MHLTVYQSVWRAAKCGRFATANRSCGGPAACAPQDFAVTHVVHQSAQDSLDQHERLKSSLTAAGLVWRQESHADKLREARDELNEDECEERPEAVPDRKVDRLERHRHCGNES